MTPTILRMIFLAHIIFLPWNLPAKTTQEQPVQTQESDSSNHGELVVEQLLVEAEESFKVDVLEAKTETEAEKEDKTETKNEIKTESKTKNKEAKTKKIKRKTAKKTGLKKFEDETYLLAQIIECEVGGQSRADKIATGSVVLNRARTNYRDFKSVNTIKEVLYQGNGTSAQQYAKETIAKIEAGIKPSKESKAVAKGLIEGEIECLEESILFQTGFVPTWNVTVVDIPGTTEVYSKPVDFD